MSNTRFALSRHWNDNDSQQIENELTINKLMQASVNSNNTASNTRFAPSWHCNDNDSQEFENELVINELIPMDGNDKLKGQHSSGDVEYHLPSMYWIEHHSSYHWKLKDQTVVSCWGHWGVEEGRDFITERALKQEKSFIHPLEWVF